MPGLVIAVEHTVPYRGGPLDGMHDTVADHRWYRCQGSVAQVREHPRLPGRVVEPAARYLFGPDADGRPVLTYLGDRPVHHGHIATLTPATPAGPLLAVTAPDGAQLLEDELEAGTTLAADLLLADLGWTRGDTGWSPDDAGGWWVPVRPW